MAKAQQAASMLKPSLRNGLLKNILKLKRKTQTNHPYLHLSLIELHISITRSSIQHNRKVEMGLEEQVKVILGTGSSPLQQQIYSHLTDLL